jgi:hypothetical protein
MGVITTQGIKFQLVAEGQILDLFQDEDIKLSDNVTGLFDLGIVPADFTRQITLPGSKKNNAFFEHVYDISVLNPDTFATNVKVPAYIDFNGIYLAQGYLQLNKVNVIANKFIDSYEVSIYGAVSSFAREINRNFLTDLTTLNAYNHTASISNITSSWTNGLFNGDIVYPMAEYGQLIQYTPEENVFGIDAENGGLCVQDYKPAIRVKKVVDAIFSEAGYTYSSSFFDQEWFQSVYLVCNRQLRYPVFTDVNPETYGQFKISPISGSGQTNWQPTNSTDYVFPWYNIEINPGANMQGDLTFRNPLPTGFRGNIQLNFEISGSGGSKYVPQFYMKLYNIDTTSTISIPLGTINDYLADVQAYNGSGGTKPQKITVAQQFDTQLVPSGSYNWKFYWNNLGSGAGTTTVTMEPDNQIKSFLQVNKASSIGDGNIMDIPLNMPYATRGIKQIDFLTALQKKFNLVMYPSKTVRNQFIIESFNNWYNKGRRWDFNKYINLNEKLEVIPANNFAVNELNFGDTLDQDYISQQFYKGANREYGKVYYVDTENFFSQGKFEVKPSISFSPLTRLAGTGVSGSVAGLNPGTTVYYAGLYRLSPYPSSPRENCYNFGYYDVYTTTGTIEEGLTVYYDSTGADIITNMYWLIDDVNCNYYSLNYPTGTLTLSGTCKDCA